MRLTVLLFFTCFLNLSASLYSQNFTFNGGTITVKDVFDKIESSSDYRFLYRSDIIDVSREVDINVQEANINSVLDKVFDTGDITYLILDDKVVVIKTIENQQQFKVTGTIKDAATGETLPGVNVVVEGTTTGAMTDSDGKYTIEVPYATATLMFSFIGFTTERVNVAGRNTIDVNLISDIMKLEEVVIVGYTRQKKETITGSVAMISTKDLKQSPTANLSNALAGRMPGLMVNQFAGGEPGVDISDIYIRGFGTYNNQSPIVVVDGVERNMNYLSAEEIESFVILKDASATAQYGIRGANGVIVITTKRGKLQDKPSLNFKASIGVNQPVKFPEYLGSADYATLYNEAITNDAIRNGSDLSSLNLFSDEAISNFRKAKGDNSDGLGYDWNYFDYAFKPGIQTDYSLSINGGSTYARYYIMANYFEQEGNYAHSRTGRNSTQTRFKRYNFRSNIDVDFTKNFYAKLDLGARLTDRRSPGTKATRIVELCNTQPSYLPIVLENNDNASNEIYEGYNPEGMLFGDQLYRFNILGELNRTGYLNEKNTYLDGTFTLGHKLDFVAKGLKIEGSFSYDASNGDWIFRQVPSYSEGYREYPSYATFTSEEGRDIYMTPGHYSGAYTTGNKFEKDQSITTNYLANSPVGRTYIQFRLDYAHKFGSHDVYAMVLGNRSKGAQGADIPSCYQGITSRVTYGFDDRYLLEFNMGYNGSENFAKGKRYGFFPAVSAGWIVSNEGFMAATDTWLDNLKIRGSYGLVGSDDLMENRFGYLQLYVNGSGYSFGEGGFYGQSGLQAGVAANPNLTWEKARKLDFGIDASLFNNQLSIVFDLFYEHRYDILTSLVGPDKNGYPDVAGEDAPFLNSGIVDNRGFDMEIGWNGRVGNDIHFYIKPNVSFARNKVIFMNEVSSYYPWRQGTGKRIGEHFCYVFDHFVADQTEANALNESDYQPWGDVMPGDVVYKDLNDDGKIKENDDQKNLGNPHTPELIFGIPLGIQYKSIDFSMTFQGATNTSVQLIGAAVYDFPSFSYDKFGKVKPMHLNRWTPETAATAKYPALHYGKNDNNKNDYSSLFLYDASYVRLKTVEVGYTLPQKFNRYLSIQKARVYFQGLNLITWDGLDDVDIDPETQEGDGAWYPVQRVFNFGIDVTF